jgi:hypothetical protein
MAIETLAFRILYFFYDYNMRDELFFKLIF